jgi:hypothetical protein
MFINAPVKNKLHVMKYLKRFCLFVVAFAVVAGFAVTTEQNTGNITQKKGTSAVKFMDVDEGLDTTVFNNAGNVDMFVVRGILVVVVEVLVTAPVALVVLGVIETGCIILVVIAVLVEVFVDLVVVVDPLFVLGVVVVVVFDVVVDCLEIVCLGVVFMLFGVVEAVVLKNFVNSLKTQSLIDFVKKEFYSHW